MLSYRGSSYLESIVYTFSGVPSKLKIFIALILYGGSFTIIIEVM